MKCFIFLIAILFSMNAIADICPAEGEAIVTTPYKLSKACPTATLVIQGERNPEEYESCLGDTPYAREQVFLQGKDNKLMPLPTVNSLLPPDKPREDFKSRHWFVGDIEPNVKCEGKNSISVGYWSGGNCNGCARTVNYTIDQNGRLKKAELK